MDFFRAVGFRGLRSNSVQRAQESRANHSLAGRWVSFRLKIKDRKADLQIGDFKTSLNHKSLARKKSSITLTFAYGSLSLRDFKMSLARVDKPAGETLLKSDGGI